MINTLTLRTHYDELLALESVQDRIIVLAQNGDKTHSVDIVLTYAQAVALKNFLQENT